MKTMFNSVKKYDNIKVFSGQCYKFNFYLMI